MISTDQLSPDQWKALFKAEPSHAAFFAASTTDHRLPAEILKRLADSSSISIHMTLAERSDLPDDIFIRLAQNPASAVRACVAANPSLPDAAFDLLVQDKNQQVRSIAAANESISLQAMSIVAKSSDMDTQSALAANSSLPDAVAQMLIGRGLLVQKALAENDRLGQEVYDALCAQAMHEGIVQQLLVDNKLSTEAMMPIARDATRMLAVLRDLLQNPRIDDRILRELWDGPKHRVVRSDILAHPLCPADILLMEMAADPSVVPTETQKRNLRLHQKAHEDRT